MKIIIISRLFCGFKRARLNVALVFCIFDLFNHLAVCSFSCLTKFNLIMCIFFVDYKKTGWSSFDDFAQIPQ